MKAQMPCQGIDLTSWNLTFYNKKKPRFVSHFRTSPQDLVFSIILYKR